MKIKILHLYPDLLNLYGDRGNIECMRKRLMWRGIDAEVVTYTCEDSGFDLSAVDIMQNNYPYSKTNRDFWYEFTNDVQPLIEMDIQEQIEADLYIVSMEEVKDV